MKTVIIGNTGSGKTWLANQLALTTGSHVVHFDEIYWTPGGFDVRRSDEDVAEIVSAHLSQPTWVAEGVFGNLAKTFLSTATELIWLDPGQDTCVLRLRARGSESKRHINREQSALGLATLIEWAQTYEARTGSSSAAFHQEIYDGFSGRKEKLVTMADVDRYLVAKRIRGTLG